MTKIVIFIELIALDDNWKIHPEKRVGNNILIALANSSQKADDDERGA